MLHTIRTYIEKHRLLRDDGSPILVGLSGGADSVALLSVLVRLGYPCIAAHCNFHLRGEESMRDEAFARQFAEKLSIPFLKIDFDTRKYASEHHISIEMAARDLRYAWFEEQRKREGAQAIAVAHHRDDSVETVVMNLVRGSGLRGLTGIRPKNGYVVRPLLCVSREEIEAWLSSRIPQTFLPNILGISSGCVCSRPWKKLILRQGRQSLARQNTWRMLRLSIPI